MEGPDGKIESDDRKQWQWKPTARTWVLIGTAVLGFVPFMLRACGVKPTRTQLPPVNMGFNSANEAQTAANSAKQLANLMKLANELRQNTNTSPTNSNEKRIRPRKP